VVDSEQPKRSSPGCGRQTAELAQWETRHRCLRLLFPGLRLLFPGLSLHFPSLRLPFPGLRLLFLSLLLMATSLPAKPLLPPPAFEPPIVSGRHLQKPDPTPAERGKTSIQAYTQIRLVMGTRLELTLVAPDETQAAQWMTLGFSVAVRLDNLLSHYKPESPLSQLGDHGGHWQRVDPALFRFLRVARRAGRLTDGAVDITVGPWVLAHQRGADEAVLNQARALINWRNVQLRPGHRVRLKKPGMRLDPGAIGKGYAVDEMVAALKAAGARHFFINFGGSSFYAAGDQPGEQGWAVAIEALPSLEKHRPIVVLKNLGMAASMAHPPLEEGGEGVPHILDPEVGTMVALDRAVVVVSPSATDADVLATALIIRGRAGLETIVPRFPGAEARVVAPEGLATTPGFDRLLVRP